MKQIVVISAILFIPLMGYCQSPGDRIVISEAYKSTIPTKVERSVIQITLDKQIQEQKKIETILNIKQEAEPLCENIVKDSTNKEQDKFICILKAIFIGGKKPWETEEQYIDKLNHSYLIDLMSI